MSNIRGSKIVIQALHAIFNYDILFFSFFLSDFLLKIAWFKEPRV